MLLFTNDPTKLLTFFQSDFLTIAITYHANKKAESFRYQVITGQINFLGIFKKSCCCKVC